MDGKDHLEKILLGKTLLWCGFSVSGSENKKQLLMSFDATGCTSIYISTCNSIYGVRFSSFHPGIDMKKTIYEISKGANGFWTKHIRKLCFINESWNKRRIKNVKEIRSNSW